MNRRINIEDTTHSTLSDSTQEFEFEWDSQQNLTVNRGSNYSNKSENTDSTLNTLPSSACSDTTQQDIGVDLRQDLTKVWDPHQSSRIRNDNFDHDIKWRDSGSPISDSKITA